MPCSSYDIAYDVRYDANPSRLASLPLPRRRLATLAVRARRQAAGLEPAPGSWRPSQRLLDVLDGALPGGRRLPAGLLCLGEPDHPEWGNQLQRLQDDFVELSAAQRELVIEFMKMLREQYRMRGPEQGED
ncbi:hypothetical protein A167_00306 [Alcanivorax sp. S71-1-4]|jgi:hypothetical protein|uniref:hypothetical protein n=1 Tax=Alcanivorax sp. S71-1-4 TaxID=1177159 RepID=UPI00135974F9|nr:hypothetical protein [Alcanivorax sp. S71-1-4]KAF0810819.1 hypothetical protein A167_00306 [Alcanivorax sp. S71-1-4]